MPQPINSPIRIQFGVRGWAAIAIALAILAAFAVLAVSFLVFLLPVLLITPILYWLMPKPKLHPVSHAMNGKISRPSTDTDIIEGEFTVVSGTTTKHQSRSSGDE